MIYDTTQICTTTKTANGVLLVSALWTFVQAEQFSGVEILMFGLICGLHS